MARVGAANSMDCRPTRRGMALRSSPSSLRRTSSTAASCAASHAYILSTRMPTWQMCVGVGGGGGGEWVGGETGEVARVLLFF